MRTPALLVSVALCAAASAACAAQGEEAARARIDWYVAAACEALGHDSAMDEAGRAIMARMERLGTEVVPEEMDRIAAVLASETEADERAAAFYCGQKADETRSAYGTAE